MRFRTAVGIVVAILLTAIAVERVVPSDRPVGLELNTFSICGLDPATGETGVAVTTRVPEVGRLCPFAKAGVGAIATQASVVVKYGPQGLELLEKGMNPEDVIEELLKDDSGREHRQIGVIDAKGNTAIHTGKQCLDHASHRAGKNSTVQGNLLASRAVIDATADAFEATEGTGMELADRLIAALEAGQKAGGDKRTGRKQSAAIVVADPRRTAYDGSNLTVHMQVAEHPEAVDELRRQYDTIGQRLGYREFRVVEGRDVAQLKRMLRSLGYFRKDMSDDEFQAYLRSEAGRLYDLETADAVDAFRQSRKLPVARDGLGHDRGIVDGEFVRALKSEYFTSQKSSE